MLIVALFVALAIACFALLTGWDRRGEQARVLRARLAAIDSAARRGPTQELALLRDELLSSIPAFNRLLSNSPKIAQLQRYLSQADVTMRAGKFILVSVSAAAFVGLFAAQLGLPAIFILLLTPAAGFGPLAYVAILRRRRFNRFEESFPEAIDLMGRSVRAGHAFSSSLELIANELADPVAGEFRAVYEEQKFGLATRDALLNLAERMPLFDVKFFVMSLLLQRETGGNLAEILDKLSYLIRERFKIHRQVRVFTAQGRLSMAILMSLPFILGLVMSFIAPQLLRLLFTDPAGQKLTALGLVMLTIGFLVIRKIVHIRV